MKWIGQHIWDFISRFRTTVYLENLETSSEENVLVVDSDGKVTKNTTLGGSDLTITNANPTRVVTSTGGSGLNAESNFTYSGTNLNVDSLAAFAMTNAGSISMQMTNTVNDANGPIFILSNNRNSLDGVNGDNLGTIYFQGMDDGTPSLTTYAQIAGEIAEASDGDEEGKLILSVASHDGEIQPGLTIASGDAEDEVDVTIGNGATSITTIAGDLDIDGDAVTAASNLTITPGGTLELDSTGNMTLDSSADIELNADGGNITFKDGSDLHAEFDFGEPSLNLYGQSGDTGSIRLYEDSDNGTNFISFRPQQNMSTNNVIELPEATGTLQIVDTVKYLLPSDFIVNDAAFVRGYLYAADDAGSDYGGTWQDAGLESWAWYQIPKGFKVIKMHAYGNTTSSTDASIYQLNPTDGTRGSALATGTWNSDRTLSTAITSSNTAVALVTLNPNASTDIIYSVKLTLATV